MSILRKLGSFVVNSTPSEPIWIAPDPGEPGFCYTEIVEDTVPIYDCINPTNQNPIELNQGACVIVGYISVEIPVTTCVPGSPGTAGGYVIPENETVVEFDDKEGWNASALGIPKLAKDGHYEFVVPINTYGVITGFSIVYDNIADRSNINFGFLINHAKYQVIEHNVLKTSQVSYNEGDVFKITKTAGMIRYYVDDVLVYVSASTVNTDLVLSVDAVEYIAGDEIVDAAIVNYSEGQAIVDILLPGIILKSGQDSITVANNKLPFVLNDSAVTSFNLQKLPGIISNSFAKGGANIKIPAIEGDAFGGTQLVTPPTKANLTLASPNAKAFIKTGNLLQADNNIPSVNSVSFQGNGGAKLILPTVKSNSYQFVFPQLILHGEIPPLETDGFIFNKASQVILNGTIPSLEPETSFKMGWAFNSELSSLDFDGVFQIHNNHMVFNDLELPTLEVLDQFVFITNGSFLLNSSIPSLEPDTAFTMGWAVISEIPSLDTDGFSINVAGNMYFTNAIELQLINTQFQFNTLDSWTLNGELPSLDNAAHIFTLTPIELVLDHEQFIMVVDPAISSNIAFAMNVANGAITKFDNYKFKKIISVKGKAYGLSIDGKLYELNTGEVDASDTTTLDIPANFITNPDNKIYNDVGELVPDQKLKRLNGVYLEIKANSKVTFEVYESERSGARYSLVEPMYTNRMDVFRVDTDLGPYCQYRQYGVRVASGQIYIDGLHVNLTYSKRKVYGTGEGI